MTFETGVSIASLVFILSLSGCGGPDPQAMTNSLLSGLAAQNGGAVVAQSSSCEVVLCYVSPSGESTDVCTDASTALSKYGVDISAPSAAGSHSGPC
jgi:hypothetical protein